MNNGMGMGTMTEEQLDLFIQAPPRKPTGDGDCPGYNKCPVSMCGCRWLYHGIPWIEGQDETERDNVTDFPAQPT